MWRITNANWVSFDFVTIHPPRHCEQDICYKLTQYHACEAIHVGESVKKSLIHDVA